MDETTPITPTREKHLRHILYGILVCTGMAHLVLTTFEVENISYIRIFIVGAIYVGLGLNMKFARTGKLVTLTGIAAGLCLVSGIIEVMVIGGHYLAISLLIFDIAIIYYVLRHRALVRSGEAELLYEGSTRPQNTAADASLTENSTAS